MAQIVSEIGMPSAKPMTPTIGPPRICPSASIWLDDELYPDSELFKQEFSHLIINQVLLGDETEVMAARNHDNSRVRKSALKFGQDGIEERISYLSDE